MIYITSDHAGYSLKSAIVEYFKSKSLEFTDLGPFEFIKSDDYPDYAHSMCSKITNHDLGIIICNNGVGVSIVCNRYNNIRAALSFNTEHAKTSKVDDNANVLALPSGFIDEKKAIEIVDAWLNTNFSNEARHINRLNKINK